MRATTLYSKMYQYPKHLWALAAGGVLFCVSCDNRSDADTSDVRNSPKTKVPEVKNPEKGIPKRIQAGLDSSATKLPGDSDLAKLGNGEQRDKLIQNAVNNYSPGDLSRFLVEQQSSLAREDLNTVSNLAYKLSLLGADGLVDGLSRIQEPWLKEFYYDALTQHLASLPNPQAYLSVAERIPAAAARQGFLTTYMAQRVRSDPASAMGDIQTLRELNPNKQFTTWYNQLVADVFVRTPVDKVDLAWPSLNTIEDKATRIIAAQQLFGALYEKDSIAATTWLNTIPDGPDKQQAISYLVQRLTNAGDLENAAAWKALLNPIN